LLYAEVQALRDSFGKYVWCFFFTHQWFVHYIYSVFLTVISRYEFIYLFIFIDLRFKMLFCLGWIWFGFLSFFLSNSCLCALIHWWIIMFYHWERNLSHVESLVFYTRSFPTGIWMHVPEIVVLWAVVWSGFSWISFHHDTLWVVPDFNHSKQLFIIFIVFHHHACEGK